MRLNCASDILYRPSGSTIFTPQHEADRGMYFCAMLITLISVDDSEYGLQT